MDDEQAICWLLHERGKFVRAKVALGDSNRFEDSALLVFSSDELAEDYRGGLPGQCQKLGYSEREFEYFLGNDGRQSTTKFFAFDVNQTDHPTPPQSVLAVQARLYDIAHYLSAKKDGDTHDAALAKSMRFDGLK